MLLPESLARTLQWGDARFSPGLLGRASWLQDARTGSPPLRCLCHKPAGARTGGRLQGASRCMDPAATFSPLEEVSPPERPSGELTFCSSFKAGSSEDASSDAKLRVVWGDQPPLELWEIAGVSPCARLTPDLASLLDTPHPPTILSQLWVSPPSVLGRSPPSPTLLNYFPLWRQYCHMQFSKGNFSPKY